VVSVTPRPRFTPRERTPGTHWKGGWVGLRAGLDAGARRKILCPCRGSNLDIKNRLRLYQFSHHKIQYICSVAQCCYITYVTFPLWRLLQTLKHLITFTYLLETVHSQEIWVVLDFLHYVWTVTGRNVRNNHSLIVVWLICLSGGVDSNVACFTIEGISIYGICVVCKACMATVIKDRTQLLLRSPLHTLHLYTILVLICSTQ
jgi:hypothetical protein